jgi:hypothetical protein
MDEMDNKIRIEETMGVNSPFLKLKDVYIRPINILAFGRMSIPKTAHTEEIHGIGIWFENLREPITTTYDTEEERDEDFALLEEFSKIVY